MSDKIDDCQKKAAELGFDLTKQFLTLAFAGIAFVVGLSFSTPGSVSGWMLWSTVIAFGLSSVLGLLFLMRGVGLLSAANNYDIYTLSLRILAGLQIMLVLVGVILLVPILNARPATKAGTTGGIEIKGDSLGNLVYTVDPRKKITIELDGGKLKITQN